MVACPDNAWAHVAYRVNTTVGGNGSAAGAEYVVIFAPEIFVTVPIAEFPPTMPFTSHVVLVFAVPETCCSELLISEERDICSARTDDYRKPAGTMLTGNRGGLHGICCGRRCKRNNRWRWRSNWRSVDRGCSAGRNCSARSAGTSRSRTLHEIPAFGLESAQAKVSRHSLPWLPPLPKMGQKYRGVFLERDVPALRAEQFRPAEQRGLHCASYCAISSRLLRLQRRPQQIP